MEVTVKLDPEVMDGMSPELCWGRDGTQHCNERPRESPQHLMCFSPSLGLSLQAHLVTLFTCGETEVLMQTPKVTGVVMGGVSSRPQLPGSDPPKLCQQERAGSSEELLQALWFEETQHEKTARRA